MQSKSFLMIIVLMLFVFLGVVSAQYAVDFDQHKWHDNFCFGEEVCLIGNFNGIGGDDIVAFVRSSSGADNDGNVWVALAAGNGFYEERVWHDSFCYGEEVCGVGDFDGDGRDDMIAFVRSSSGTENDGNVWVALSDGQQFVDARVWHDNFCYSIEACLIGDFNGDGADDIAAVTGPTTDGNGPADIWVTLSNESAFLETRVWGQISGCALRGGEYSCMVGDFDGDGDDDIVSHDWETDSVWVATSNRNGFSNEEIWLNTRRSNPNGDYPYLCNQRGQACSVGDFDNDGKDDLFTFVGDTMADNENTVFINPSFGIAENSNREVDSGFAYTLLAQDAYCLDGTVCRIADINDDGRADLVVFYRSLFPDDTLAGDVFVAINRYDR